MAVPFGIRRLAVASMVTLAACSGAWAQQGAGSASDTVITAITQPSDRRELSFKMMGVVLEQPVRDGSVVKQGDTLLVQDNRLEQAQLEAMQLIANSDLEIEFAAKDLEVRRIQLERVKEMHGKQVSSDKELEEARLQVDRAETQLKLSKQEKQQRLLEARAKGFQVEVMAMQSPIDGVVERVITKGGEVTDPQKPSIVVVKNDPLWVVMYLPNKMVDRINKDDAFQVRYGPDGEWKQAKVQFISPVADAASFKRLVRLELPNPDQKASGYEIFVKLPEKLNDAGRVAAGR